MDEMPGRQRVGHTWFLVHEEGQGLVEYALILLLVALVVIAAVTLFGGVVGNTYSHIVGSFPGG